MREWASEVKFSARTLPMSAYGLNVPQDPLNSNVKEEVIEREEEEVIKEYYSDFDPQLSEDEEM